MKTDRRKYIAPILVTIIMIAYYAIYFFLLISILSGIMKYVLGIAPLALSIVMIKVCIERIQEIKKGEEHDLSQY